MAWNLALYSFVADITAPEYRVTRMAIVHLAQSLSRPVATPIGAWLLDAGIFHCLLYF